MNDTFNPLHHYQPILKVVFEIKRLIAGCDPPSVLLFSTRNRLLLVIASLEIPVLACNKHL